MTEQRSIDDDQQAGLSQPDSGRTATHPGVSSDRAAGGSRAGTFTPGTMLAGRYRIVAPLGSGGDGEVYRAEDTKLGQTVALKFITQRIANERELLDRIVAEVRIGRQVAHPNLCRIYDMGEVGNHYFIAMEYVDGENLASLLRRVGRLPEERALEVTREICAGLAAAHDRGVVHRDMKPSNVMIDGRGHARITDYGLAVAPGEASTDAFAGTPAYMAPEQLDGAEATEQSDIYSLGLLLYELFTGQRLFTGSIADIANAHTQPKRPPSTIVRGLNPSTERVILHCLEEMAGDRPDSVREMLAALPGGDPLRAAIEAGETPSPREVAAAERVGELPLRTAWAGAGVMLVLIATVWAMSRYSMLYRQVPLTMSPDVLSDRARQIIRSAGYEPQPAGSRRWISNDLDVLKGATAGSSSLDRAPAFKRISPLRFGYRESPAPLVPRGRGATVTASDPPFDVPGMTSVTLDSSGRLVRFIRAPVASPGGNSKLVEWTTFFEFAGLDESRFHGVTAVWISPVDHESKHSWTGTVAGSPPLNVDVRAATSSGYPVFFETAVRLPPPAGRPVRAGVAAIATEEFTGVAGFAAIFVAALIVAAIIARRNIRLGRGDRAAARKLSLLVFASLFLAGLLSADHTPDPAGEWGLLVGVTGNALYHAGAI